MSNIYADRVKETTATTGTGTISLAGAATQFQSFSAGVGNGNTCDYCLLSGNGTDWEVGNGTYTASGNTLARTAIYSSSNSGAAISLSGTSTVFLTASAARIARGGLYQPVMSAVPTQANTGFTTWLIQPTGATVADTPVGMNVYCPSQSSATNLSALKQSAPSTPYSFSTLIAPGFALNVTTSPHVAWIFGFSDGTKTLAFYYDTSNGFNVEEISALSGGSLTSVFNESLNFHIPQAWVKISDDGTNLKFFVSYDGYIWSQVYSIGRTAYLTAPTYVVFGNLNYSGAGSATLMSWTQGTS
jgi:hypothetical protein